MGDAERSQRWLTDEEQAAWRGWQRVQAQLTARLNRQLADDTGLSLQDYGVLVVLSDQPEGRMRAFELGRELGWEKSRLSHHVSRMAARGLVVRERCPTDQRGLYVTITARGRKALASAAPGHVDEVRRSFIDVLTPAQVAALADIAETVLAAMADARADPPGEGPSWAAAQRGPGGAGGDA